MVFGLLVHPRLEGSMMLLLNQIRVMQLKFVVVMTVVHRQSLVQVLHQKVPLNNSIMYLSKLILRLMFGVYYIKLKP